MLECWQQATITLLLLADFPELLHVRPGPQKPFDVSRRFHYKQAVGGRLP